MICRVYLDYPALTEEIGMHLIRFWCNSCIGGSESYQHLKDILNEMLKEYSNSLERESIHMKSLKYQLIATLSREYMIQGEENLEVFQDKRIESTVKYIMENFSQGISLSDAASAAYMSDSSFSRLFKKTMGVNFIEYVNKIRLRYAVEELLFSTKSVTVIAEDCGFATPSAFNKLFKKEYQCSPTEYRNTMRKNMEGADESNEFAAVKDQLDQLLKDETNARQRPESGKDIIIANGEILFTAPKEGNQCINMGAATDLLVATVRDHLLRLKTQLGFRYVRFSGIFSERMYLYEDSEMKRLNFGLIFNVLDYLLDIGMIPFIELTTQDKRTYLDAGQDIYSKDQGIIFDSTGKWVNLLETFFREITARYGNHRIESWLFEFNEKHYAFLFQGKNAHSYATVWEAVYRSVKKVNPCIMLGSGNAYLNTDGNRLREFLLYTKPRNCMPDYLSVRMIPYRGKPKTDDIYSNRETDGGYFAKGLHQMIHILKELGLEEQYLRTLGDQDCLPLGRIVVSQWDTSVSQRNAYNDSCGKAAHILHEMIGICGMGIMCCYYRGSDFLSQYFDTATPVFGASGLLTMHGIPKTTFWAFSFMNRIYEYIIKKGEFFAVSTNGKGRYCILMCNPKNFNHTFFLKRESDIEVADLKKIYEDKLERNFEIELSNMRPGRYRVKKEVIGPDHGDVLAKWQQMDYVTELMPFEIEYLKSVCQPTFFYQEIQAPDGKLKIEETLQVHEIVRLDIYQLE